MNAETITHTTFKELVEAGAVRGTCAVAFGDRWGLVFSYGGVEKTFRAIFREFCQLGQVKNIPDSPIWNGEFQMAWGKDPKPNAANSSQTDCHD